MRAINSISWSRKVKSTVKAGNKASDISNTLAQEMRELPNKSGYVFIHTYIKILRGGDGKRNLFIIKRWGDISIRPISALEQYFALSFKLGFN